MVEEDEVDGVCECNAPCVHEGGPAPKNRLSRRPSQGAGGGGLGVSSRGGLLALYGRRWGGGVSDGDGDSCLRCLAPAAISEAARNGVVEESLWAEDEELKLVLVVVEAGGAALGSPCPCGEHLRAFAERAGGGDGVRSRAARPRVKTGVGEGDNERGFVGEGGEAGLVGVGDLDARS